MKYAIAKDVGNGELWYQTNNPESPDTPVQWLPKIEHAEPFDSPELPEDYIRIMELVGPIISVVSLPTDKAYIKARKNVLTTRNLYKLKEIKEQVQKLHVGFGVNKQQQKDLLIQLDRILEKKIQK